MKFRKLRHRVTIEKQQQAPDGQGGYVISWVSLATVWAQITPLRGNELYHAQQINQQITHKISMRYRNDLKPDMRINYRNRIFQILAVIDVGELGKELQLLCAE